MVRAAGPGRVRERVVKILLHIIDHFGLVFGQARGHESDARGVVGDHFPVIAINRAADVVVKQMNHPFLVGVADRAFDEELFVSTPT